MSGGSGWRQRLKVCVGGRHQQHRSTGGYRSGAGQSCTARLARVARKPAWRGRAALFGAGRRPMQEHSLVPMHGPGDAESETCGTGPDRPESGSAAGSWPIPALQRQLQGCKPSVDNKRERRRRPASKLRWVGRLPVASPPSVCPQPRPHPKEGQVARRRRSRGGHQRAEEAAGIRGPGARIRARGPHPKARRGEARPGGRSGGSGPSGFSARFVHLCTDICATIHRYLYKDVHISAEICTDICTNMYRYVLYGSGPAGPWRAPPLPGLAGSRGRSGREAPKRGDPSRGFAGR